LAQRGEIWSRRASGGVPGDLVLIISDNRINDGTDFVICLLVTMTHYGLSYHIEIPPGQSGQADPAYIQCDEIYKSPSHWLAHRQGAVARDTMRRVERCLQDLLDL